MRKCAYGSRFNPLCHSAKCTWLTGCLSAARWFHVPYDTALLHPKIGIWDYRYQMAAWMTVSYETRHTSHSLTLAYECWDLAAGTQNHGSCKRHTSHSIVGAHHLLQHDQLKQAAISFVLAINSTCCHREFCSYFRWIICMVTSAFVSKILQHMLDNSITSSVKSNTSLLEIGQVTLSPLRSASVSTLDAESHSLMMHRYRMDCSENKTWKSIHERRRVGSLLHLLTYLNGHMGRSITKLRMCTAVDAWRVGWYSSF